MHDASRRCPALKLFVSNIFFSLTGGETFSMCFWSDMEGERLESFLNIIYQYTISYQNLNLKIYSRILNIIGIKIGTLILRQFLNKCLYFYSLKISELSFTVQTLRWDACALGSCATRQPATAWTGAAQQLWCQSYHFYFCSCNKYILCSFYVWQVFAFLAIKNHVLYMLHV